MAFKSKIAALAIPLTMVLGASGAFAKAHDQGVADGMAPDDTSAFIQTLGGEGVSTIVNDGERGTGDSGDGGDNRVTPVDQPGQNKEPD